jgi:hypothetical protein
MSIGWEEPVKKKTDEQMQALRDKILTQEAPEAKAKKKIADYMGHLTDCYREYREVQE